MINALDHRKSDYPIEKLFVARWSPRAMTGEPLSDAEIRTLFEAARWRLLHTTNKSGDSSTPAATRPNGKHFSTCWSKATGPGAAMRRCLLSSSRTRSSRKTASLIRSICSTSAQRMKTLRCKERRWASWSMACRASTSIKPMRR